MEKNNIKILAIDDKNDNLISLKAIIKDIFPNSTIFTELNGAEGITTASAENPDVILLDIVMPDMDGFEVCRLLKKNEKTRDIPVVFLTALKGDKESRIKALEAGAEAFLSKPIDETELTAQIRAMVKIKEANLRKRNEKEYLEKLVSERTSELEQSRVATLNLLDDLKAEIEVRKKTENELEKNRQFLADVIENSGTLIFVKDLEGKYNLVNSKWQEVTGFSREQTLGKTNIELFPGYIGKQFNDNDLSVIRSQILQVFEEVLEQNGSLRYFHSIKFPMKDKSGKINGTCGMATEITDRKKAEEAIRESENKFRNLITQMQSGLAVHEIILDEKGVPVNYRFLDVNPSFERLTGLKKENVIGKTVLEILPGTEKLWIEKYGRVALTGEPVSFENYHQELDKFYSVIAYQPREKQFAVVIEDVTDRKKAEENLKENLALLRIAGEVAKMGGWNVNLKENRSYWSDEVAAIHEMPAGFSPLLEEGISFYAPEWREKITQVFANCAKKGISYNERMEIITATGKRVWIKTIGEAVRNEKGEIFKVHGAFQDISDQVKSEESIRESEDRFRTVSEYSHNGICIIDLSGKIIWANDSLAKIGGYSKEQMYSTESFIQFIAPESVEFVVGNFMKFAAGEKYEHHYSFYLIKSNGEKRLCEKHMTDYKDRSGNRFLTISMMDVTDQRKAENELRKSEEKFRQLADSTTAGIFIHSGEEFQYINNSTTIHTGFSQEELYKMKFIDLVYPDDRQMVIDIWHARNKGAHIPSSYECRLNKKGGGFIWAEISANLLDFKGKTALIGTAFDITDRKLAEIEKEKLKDQLIQAQKMESIGRLAGGVAHDFNNMLSVIIGRTELAMMKTDPQNPSFKELDEIKNAAERSANLTGQLLAFARKQVITPKVVSLNDELGKTFEMLKRLIGENIKLSWKKGKDLWNIKIDPVQIDQIVANLCVNSKDAIKGDGKIVIETENVTITQEDLADLPGMNIGDFVILKVRDNGYGMDDETVKHIFEPFFTTKDIGKGTGLGLATVFGIVKQNQGFIYVESKPGKGTLFKIYLPRQTEKTTKTDKEKSSANSSYGGQTILLVEDEQAILEMGELMLQSFGYTVVLASSPQEAIKKAVEHSGTIDLLITDVIMPEMNGRELSKKITSLYPEIKCLFMSGYTADIIAHQGVVDEKMNFIQKPFSIKNLGEKVKTVMSEK